jgi:predicted AAA+ superfamily ATPase
MCFPNHAYVNLEDRTAREIATSDPKAFFELYKAPLIVDEVQRVLELLSTIQTLAGASRAGGYFILTGSHQPQLPTQISQSLAGHYTCSRFR